MIVLNLGRRECGKTTLALWLVQSYPYTVYFDPRGLLPASSRAVDVDGVIEAFDRLHDEETRAIVVTPARDVQRCFARTATEVKNWLDDFGDARRPLGFVVDELRLVDPRADDFAWLLRCPPRDALTIVLTAHRPTDVPPDIRAIADVWCLFQTTEGRDVDLIRERCSPIVAESATHLAPRHFVSWDDRTAVQKFHTDPRRWYVPLAISAAQID